MAKLDLVFEEARRSLDNQQRVLDELRSRVGNAISALAIATSFLGAVALEQGGMSYWSVSAFVCFGVALVAFVVVLLPQRESWHFRFKTDLLLTSYEKDASVTEDEMKRDLAMHMESNYQHNKKKLEPLFRLFAVGVSALGLELAAWLLEIGG